MKVTLLTVTYNAERYLEDCIQSVISQDYKDIEYIVIDGASTDGTVSIIKQYSNYIHEWISEKDCGMYDALNKGMKMATGDIIGIINSDDILASRHTISKIANCFQQRRVESVFGDLIYIDNKDQNRLHRIWKGIPYRRNNFHYGWMPAHPTFYFRKEVAEEIGGYNLKYGTAADFEFMLRYLYKHQISSYYLPEMVVKMRKGGQSNRSLLARLKANRMDYLAMKANNLPHPLMSSFLKPTRKIPQFLTAFTNEKVKHIKKQAVKLDRLIYGALEKAFPFTTFL